MEQILSIKQVAKVINVSVSTVRRLERKGCFINKVRIPGSSRTGYLSSDLQKYIGSIAEKGKDLNLAFSNTWRKTKGVSNEK